MPTTIQKFLLEGSIFDALCKIWFMPSVSLYIKRFFLPFFVKMSREEVYSMIHEINPSLATKLGTKGILFILPSSFQKILLPKIDTSKLPKATDINATHIRETLRAEIPAQVSSIRYLDHPNPTNSRHFNTELDSTRHLTESRRRTEIISSGGPSKKDSTDIDSKILAISDRIPTLKPFISKLLGLKVRKIMEVFSHKWLAGCCAVSGITLILQILFSVKARKWSVMGIKLITFLSSLGILAGSSMGLFLKFLHERTREPQIRKLKEKKLVEKFGGFSTIESRFDRYDRHEKYTLFQ